MLDINKGNSKKQFAKIIWVYVVLSLVAIIADKIYDIFGHGVDSPAMTWMFLYPLLGGALFYLIINMLFPHINGNHGFRGFFNMHNSGVATLNFASFLKGVFEIAGTSSSYLKYYYVVGCLFIVVGVINLIIVVINKNKVHQ
ncbi:hypothetical protein J2Z44_002870 [Clostridium punense]|uniref:Uncharacterized protein n=1 Tax=Clostridium punense TaxID=1054297 RepID=A0ABS4K5J3_9CLOT|nr:MULTISPECIES: hypothetical protein [Clostridium]EQB87261.1 hypothetical protein M918_09825 [Clostridium sp. BL8]MBP2023045.1 hypothetical protein [Clostridium punense]